VVDESDSSASPSAGADYRPPSHQGTKENTGDWEFGNLEFACRE
jgi:hypothetical protein